MLGDLQDDVAHAGGLVLVHRHMGHVNAGFLGGFQHDLAEGVVPHLAYHGDLGSQTGALDGLIGPFAAGSGLEFFANDGFAGGRRAAGRGDQVHHKAAHDQNFWFFQHKRSSFPHPLMMVILYRKMQQLKNFWQFVRKKSGGGHQIGNVSRFRLSAWAVSHAVV